MRAILLLTVCVPLLVPGMVAGADAAANYKQHCARCHGDDGRGKTKAGQRLGARDYTDPKVQASVTDQDIERSIKEGYKDKTTGREIMKPTKGLTDAEVKELVAYIRKFKKD
ncbi:MAG: cytochrome c [Verrucomicrobiae bacterium]|nr:cytochrome c [Verrucomicrobiae bacterium]